MRRPGEGGGHEYQSQADHSSDDDRELRHHRLTNQSGRGCVGLGAGQAGDLHSQDHWRRWLSTLRLAHSPTVIDGR